MDKEQEPIVGVKPRIDRFKATLELLIYYDTALGPYDRGGDMPSAIGYVLRMMCDPGSNVFDGVLRLTDQVKHLVKVYNIDYAEQYPELVIVLSSFVQDMEVLRWVYLQIFQRTPGVPTADAEKAKSVREFAGKFVCPDSAARSLSNLLKQSTEYRNQGEVVTNFVRIREIAYQVLRMAKV